MCSSCCKKNVAWFVTRCHINTLLSTVTLRAAIKPKYNLVLTLKNVCVCVHTHTSPQGSGSIRQQTTYTPNYNHGHVFRITSCVFPGSTCHIPHYTRDPGGEKNGSKSQSQHTSNMTQTFTICPVLRGQIPSLWDVGL